MRKPETYLGAEFPDGSPEIYLVWSRSPNDQELPAPDENSRRHTVRLWSPGIRREKLGRAPDGAELMNRSTNQNPSQADAVTEARFVHFANHQSASRLASQPALLELVGGSHYPVIQGR